MEQWVEKVWVFVERRSDEVQWGPQSREFVFSKVTRFVSPSPIPSQLYNIMASPDPDGHYHNGHHAFLQAFFARPTLTFVEAKPILAKIMSIQGIQTSTLTQTILTSI